MNTWPYSADSPNLGWTDYLTLEEMQALWALTCIWRRDNEPDVGAATNFDEMMRLGVRKLSDEAGYTWASALEVSDDLEVSTPHEAPEESAIAIRNFLRHLMTALQIPNFPWPNYESAFKATLAFLQRELPSHQHLQERVRAELAMLREALDRVSLGGMEESDVMQMIAEAEERHEDVRDLNRARIPKRGVM